MNSPSDEVRGIATAAMNATTSSTRAGVEASPGRRSSHCRWLILAARPVAWPSSCHARAVLTTSARFIPISRNISIPLSTIPARLAPNSSSAPWTNAHFPIASPNPATPSGGTSATATATPGIEAESRASREAVTTAPASPENTAMARSSVVGRVRLAISSVTAPNGSARVRSAASATMPAAPRMIVAKVWTNSRPSPTASASERPSSGPSSGATSMAPITTAVEFSTRPSVAMAPERSSTAQNGTSVSVAASAVSRYRSGRSHVRSPRCRRAAASSIDSSSSGAL